ncbi:1-phosphofructokinase family hexose kinase [Actinokineospora xionganensis]|uniref:1-phosphofructokinase family hexose kinase n=1 Tax=Actinokineospora xionganensis TaxID=2684470 RepID=A0ABR7LDW7_9PSEU|nr:1-phosphofructokinase family hexose kinase [Actinokineospora xionganensis]MBC6450698.1 1-phosphofructokinase family hexose kinase [Actinokineospora xionganensis]
MIVTVTPNAALDVTYVVPALLPNGSHRVTSVRSRAGGKGINVARVLARQGIPVIATGLVGGPTGSLLDRDLAAARVVFHPYEVAAESRRTVTVVADGDATVFNEPGEPVTAAEWAGFRGHLAGLLADARLVVLSGSLPPGLGFDAYADLVRVARAHGCRTVLDTSGDALLAGIAAGADVVKPNAVELFEATGESDPVAAAQALRRAGAGAVVASLGPDGMVAVTADGCWRARPDRRISGNPTGAGDAGVAALAAGLVAGNPWPDLIREAVAWSAAAVAAPLAGDIDEGTRDELRAGVNVEELDAASRN